MPEGTLGDEASGFRSFFSLSVKKVHSTIMVPTTLAEASPRSSRLVSAASLGGDVPQSEVNLL